MKFHRGQPVLRTMVGPIGVIASEKTKVSSASKRGVYVKNKGGGKSAGPFHPKTGRYPERDRIFKTKQFISSLARKVN